MHRTIISSTDLSITPKCKACCYETNKREGRKHYNDNVLRNYLPEQGNWADQQCKAERIAQGYCTVHTADTVPIS